MQHAERPRHSADGAYPRQGNTHHAVIRDDVDVTRRDGQILNVLGKADADGQRQDALALLLDRMRHPTVREELAAVNGASSILVQLLAEQNRKLVALACAVVESLSLCMLGREELIRANVLPALHAALKSVPRAATTALGRLLSSREGKAAVVFHTPVILRALRDLLNEHEPLDVATHCVQCLASLCETPEGCRLSLKYGLPDLVSNTVKELRDSEEAQDALFTACARYFRIVASTPTGRTAIREADAIQALDALLHRGISSTCISQTVTALMLLSIDVPSKQAIVDHCLERLASLLEAHPDSVESGHIKAALACCCEDRAASQAIKKRLGFEATTSVLGSLPRFAPHMYSVQS